MRASVFVIFCLAVGTAPSFALPSEVKSPGQVLHPRGNQVSVGEAAKKWVQKWVQVEGNGGKVPNKDKGKGKAIQVTDEMVEERLRQGESAPRRRRRVKERWEKFLEKSDPFAPGPSTRKIEI
ncbi:hypothetical protein F5148DRAFT_632462 [Russula earlei]|uniref:Uncharacterized protein n=1 Tax=Russula earlei TaxID=71964 RepID=A0ACC0UEW5_9AGAM|nr:hypothetical protein F5148DRAFT_632462 [Russula earlei]